jgi:hypothetical protein
MPALSHDIIKVRMRIVSKREGKARFLAAEADVTTYRKLTSTSKDFQNRKFRSFEQGSIVIATFRISPTGRRFLLNIRPEDKDAVKEEVKIEKPMIEVIDGFYYPPPVKRVFSMADEFAKKEGMITLLMVGPSGYGKTTFPQKFAEKTGRNHVRINCAAIRDPEEWLGFREAKDGSTVFEASEFARALQQGHSVIVLDEINRLEPWLHNTLFPLLDDDRATTVHNRKFEVADDTVFVLTLNQGVEFTGTFELDQAFMNRVHATMHVSPPPAKHEIEVVMQRTGLNQTYAKQIVNTANKLRDVAIRNEADVDCSTRAVLRVAMLFPHLGNLRHCFHDVIESASHNAETRKKLSDVLNSELGIFEEEVHDSVFDQSE